MIAVDIETVDPNLELKGPGAVRGNGHLKCIGIYGEGTQGVFRPEDPVVKDILANNSCKVFHNASYDLQWLYSTGYKVNGVKEDTMVRAALIDPTQKHVTLDACCKRYGVESKNSEDTIERWWKDNKDPKDKRSAIKALDDIPFDITAMYCLNDCRATYDLFKIQDKYIQEMGLEKIALTERELINVTLRMLMNGIRIDDSKVQSLIDQYDEECSILEEQVLLGAGIVNVNSPVQIRHYFEDELHLTSHIKTPTGANSWDKWALLGLEDPIADAICTLRSRETVLSTFLKGSLSDLWKGRAYTQLHQTGRDDGGTITGRYSSSKPNLQNIPSHEDKGGPEIRSMFLPDEGCTLCAFDYKQIEYRIFAHYAIAWKVDGYEALAEAMRSGADYHLFVQKMVDWYKEGDDHYNKEMRRVTKTMNFGILYGMGKQKCLDRNRKMFKAPKGMTKEQYVDKLYKNYFDRLTFVRPTNKKIESAAAKNGYVRSIGGRRHPTEYDALFRSPNKLIQGGAADRLKEGLVRAEREGYWDYCKLHLTVHDENVFSIPNDITKKQKEELLYGIGRAMAGEDDLNVPIGVDLELGPDWGHVSDDWMKEAV